MLPLHHIGDQSDAGIRTQTLFFPERLFKIAAKNLTVEKNRILFLTNALPNELFFHAEKVGIEPTTYRLIDFAVSIL